MDLLRQFVDLDPRPLLAVIGWINLTLVVLNIGYWTTDAGGRRYGPLKLFTVSKFFQALAFFMILGRDRLPDVMSYYMANPLLFIGMYAEARFVCELMGLKSRTADRILAGIVVLGTVAYVWSERVYDDNAHRIIFACIPYICIMSVPTSILLFGRRNDNFARFLGVLYLAFTVTQIGRVHMAWTNRDMTVFTADMVQSIGFIMQILLNVVSASVLFIALKKSLDETNRLREQELLESARIADTANRMKTQFLATVSHEIRTPLNAVLGLTHLSLADAGLPPRLRGHLKQVDASAQSLLSIIDDILDISNAESGKIELEKVPFRLSDVFRACRAAVEPQTEEKGLSLAIDGTVGGLGDDVRLLGDPLRLRQVLLKLLSNAVKFTDAGGIRLTASRVPEAGGGDDGVVRIRFEVTDTGIGMTPDEVSRLFQPFAQADRSTTRKYGGTGLGLAIAKNIVRLMGGSISVSSMPGVGSRFLVTVPFEPALEASPDAFRLTRPPGAEDNVPLENVEKK